MMLSNKVGFLPSISKHSIQQQIIWLVVSFLVILSALASVYLSFSREISRIEQQLDNQLAKQDVGISIYHRLFAAETLVFKLGMQDNFRELGIVANRFAENLRVVQNGLQVLQNGGLFEDKISVNIPGKDSMHLQAYYEKPEHEGYVLEALQLGPALYDLDEQVQLFIRQIESRIKTGAPVKDSDVDQTQNILKKVDTILLRSQENAARVLYETQQSKEVFSEQLKQAEEDHARFLIPVVGLSLGVALLILFISLVRINRAIAERKQAEEQFHNLLEATAEGIYGIDITGKTMFANPAVTRMLGYTSEELVGRENHTLIHHSHSDGTHYPGVECRMLEVLRTGVAQTVDDEVLWSKNGDCFPVEYSSTPIKHDGKVVGAVVNFRDISERKAAEKKIRMLSQAVDQSPVSVVITNLDGNIEYVNSAFSKATGYSAEEVTGKNPRILQSGNTPKSIYDELWQAVTRGQSWQGEFQNRKKSGEVFTERAYIAPVIDRFGTTTHYLAVKEDISLQKQQEEKIIHQANYDTLTDLPNRLLTMDRLDQLVKESQRNERMAAVMFLDLDDFKSINDNMSHEVGDQLLVQAAQRLRDSVRDEDTVSRLGGDEFIVLMGNLSQADDVCPVAEKLLERFRNTFLLDGVEVTVTVSVGISVYPNDGKSPAELLHNADTALYKSKQQGRNAYNFFTNEMNLGVSRRLLLEEQLHGALARNEFQLVYWPLVEIESKRVVGAGAELRWNNAVLGRISSDELTSVAEKTGQLVGIGQFVLNEALSKTAQWQHLIDRDFKVAIGLSQSQFRDLGMEQKIMNALGQFGVSPQALELEIGEAVLMGGRTNTVEVFAALRELGIGITLDNFGTGYSSLSCLTNYPFLKLKLDSRFIKGIGGNPSDRALVNSAIAMAHELGIKVVAVGVETEQQLIYLTEQGCDFAQGAFISAAVSADEMTRLLESEHERLALSS